MSTVPVVPPSRPSGLVSVRMPSYLEKEELQGMEVIDRKVRPAFLKIVQKQSSDELLKEFGMGTAILVPDRMKVVTAEGPPVRIVPLFVYSEYLKLTSMELKDVEPMIADRSIDPMSDVARRCMDRKLWSEPHPKHMNDSKYNYRYAESLNFMCAFQEEHLDTGLPFILPFSKSAFGRGQQFCNLIKMRKMSPFACVFELSIDPVPGKNAKGEWRRVRIDNPVENPWVMDPAVYNVYKAKAADLADLHKKGLLEATYDVDDEEAGGGPDVNGADVPY